MSDGSIGDVISNVLSQVAPGKPWPARIPKIIHFLTSAPRDTKASLALRVDRAREMAAKCGLSLGCQDIVYHILERWNGKGQPQGLRGAFISVPSRIVSLAQTVEQFYSVGGPQAALKMVGERRGKFWDPRW